MELAPAPRASQVLDLHQLRHVAAVDDELSRAAVLVRLARRLVQQAQQLAHAADRDAERLDEEEELGRLEVLQR